MIPRLYIHTLSLLKFHTPFASHNLPLSAYHHTASIQIYYINKTETTPRRIGCTNSVKLKDSIVGMGFRVENLGEVDAEHLKELQDSDGGCKPP